MEDNLIAHFLLVHFEELCLVNSSFSTVTDKECWNATNICIIEISHDKKKTTLDWTTPQDTGHCQHYSLVETETRTSGHMRKK